MQQDHFLGSIVESKLLKFNIVSQGKTKHQKGVTSRDIVSWRILIMWLLIHQKKTILRLTDKIQVPLFISLMCFKRYMYLLCQTLFDCMFSYGINPLSCFVDGFAVDSVTKAVPLSTILLR